MRALRFILRARASSRFTNPSASLQVYSLLLSHTDQIRLAGREKCNWRAGSTSKILRQQQFLLLNFARCLSGVLFQSSYTKYSLKNNTDMLTFVGYFILVCFQLNLTARFKGVQYHVEKHFFLCQKTYKEQFTNFRAIEQISTRIRACEQLQKFCEHEQASTRLNFASKSSKGQILLALEDFQGPFNTPSLQIQDKF